MVRPDDVLDALRTLDGMTRSAVRLLTGSTDSEIDALGGFEAGDR